MASTTLVYTGPGSPMGKIWTISTKNDGGLMIQYGPRGKTLRTSHVPPSTFGVVNQDVEMERRINNKLAKGYVIVKSDDDEPEDSLPQSGGDAAQDAPARKPLAASSETLGTWFF